MLKLLIVTGRVIMVVSAVLVIIAGAVAGYMAPEQYPAIAANALAPYSPARIIGAVAGLIGGVISAAFVFGLAAAIFDIQRRVAAAMPLGNERGVVGTTPTWPR